MSRRSVEIGAAFLAGVLAFMVLATVHWYRFGRPPEE